MIRRECVRNPHYFIDRYCRVQADTGAGMVPFHLFGYQKDLLSTFLAHQQIIILKARQLGITELVAAYAVWKSLRPYQTIVAISQGEDEAGELVRKARMAWEHLPPFLRVALRDPSLTSRLEFVNGSRILPRPATSRSGRSLAAHLLIIDEWANQIDPAGVYEAAAPAALSAGNQVIGLSTAKQAGDFFHQQWQRAEEGKGAHPVFLPYTSRPGHDAAWLAEQTRTLQDWQRQRAYPSVASEAFTLSGRPRFDQTALTTIAAHCEPPIDTTPLGDGALRIWEAPSPGRRYVLAADTAEGLPKGDYSVGVVLDWESGVEVAELHGHWEPAVFAAHLAALGKRYNGCTLAVERNNHGHAVLLALRSIERYPDLYRHVEYDAKAHGTTTERDGWQTSSKSKPIMIDGLATAIREMGEGTRAPAYRSSYFVSEARTYAVLDNGDTGASGSLFDDRVVAYAIAEQVRRAPPAGKPMRAASGGSRPLLSQYQPR